MTDLDVVLAIGKGAAERAPEDFAPQSILIPQVADSHINKAFVEIQTVGRHQETTTMIAIHEDHIAAIIERRKYGAIGWNIQYQWMTSDFETSRR